VSINEKDITELDIVFSKMHSENISNIFVEDFYCHPSGRAVFCPPVISNSLCDFRWYSFVWIYQHGWAHHSGSIKGKHSRYGWFCEASLNFTNIFVPFAC
jgi:hypothetical protein